MKKQLLHTLSVLFFTLGTTMLFAQDTWVPSITHGFGDPNNQTIKCLQSFKGNIYAGLGEDTAAIYSSTTGNYGSWNYKYSSLGVFGIECFATVTDGGGYIYAGTYGSGNPAS